MPGLRPARVSMRAHHGTVGHRSPAGCTLSGDGVGSTHASVTVAPTGRTGTSSRRESAPALGRERACPWPGAPARRTGFSPLAGRHRCSLDPGWRSLPQEVQRVGPAADAGRLRETEWEGPLLLHDGGACQQISAATAWSRGRTSFVSLDRDSPSGDGATASGRNPWPACCSGVCSWAPPVLRSHCAAQAGRPRGRSEPAARGQHGSRAVLGERARWPFTRGSDRRSTSHIPRPGTERGRTELGNSFRSRPGELLQVGRCTLTKVCDEAVTRMLSGPARTPPARPARARSPV